MLYKIAVPALVADLEEVRVLEWHGVEGHQFGPGELIVELETHKAIIEVRAAQAGMLRRILCTACDWCRIGVPIALFGDGADETLPDEAATIEDLRVDFEVT